MKTNAYRSILDDNSLATAIRDELIRMTERFSFVLPDGWRFIAKLIAEDDSGSKEELFFLDQQADNGGGSWAEAKIQTMEKMDYVATRPMTVHEIADLIRGAGMEDAKFGKMVLNGAERHHAKTSEDLCEGELAWLTNVKNGPGIAPGLGGISLDMKCHYFKSPSPLTGGLATEPISETETLYLAFSGAQDWQDLQFSVSILAEILNHFGKKTNESFEFDFSQLKEISEVRFWLENYGIRM